MRNYCAKHFARYPRHRRTIDLNWPPALFEYLWQLKTKQILLQFPCPVTNVLIGVISYSDGYHFDEKLFLRYLHKAEQRRLRRLKQMQQAA
jgi:hypothetical protein